MYFSNKGKIVSKHREVYMLKNDQNIYCVLQKVIKEQVSPELCEVLLSKQRHRVVDIGIENSR